MYEICPFAGGGGVYVCVYVSTDALFGIELGLNDKKNIKKKHSSSVGRKYWWFYEHNWG
jgi:hypothetical protein